MIFDWQPQYSVGFEEIDALHRGVFRAAGDLHAAIVAGRPPQALADLRERMIAVIEAHLDGEEALMQSSQYPEAARHKAKHAAMTDSLARGRGTTPGLDTMQALKGMLVQHIDEEDRELGRHLASRARA